MMYTLNWCGFKVKVDLSQVEDVDGISCRVLIPNHVDQQGNKFENCSVTMTWGNYLKMVNDSEGMN